MLIPCDQVGSIWHCWVSQAPPARGIDECPTSKWPGESSFLLGLRLPSPTGGYQSDRSGIFWRKKEKIRQVTSLLILKDLKWKSKTIHFWASQQQVCVTKVNTSFNKHLKHPMLNVAKLLGFHCQKQLYPSSPHIPPELNAPDYLFPPASPRLFTLAMAPATTGRHKHTQCLSWQPRSQLLPTPDGV